MISCGLDNIKRRAQAACREKNPTLMLFGSVARGDHRSDSDIDILQLVEEYTPSYVADGMNFSLYTIDSLKDHATSGSLFVLHLITEGQIISDPEGKLASVLNTYRKPSSYRDQLLELCGCVNILRVDSRVYAKNPALYNHAVIFVLRSVVFLMMAQTGSPTFSIGTIARRLGDETIVEAVSFRSFREANFNYYNKCFSLVSKYIGMSLGGKLAKESQAGRSGRLTRFLMQNLHGTTSFSNYS